MNTQDLQKLKDAKNAVACYFDPTDASSEQLSIIMGALPELIAIAERTSSAGSAVVMSDEHRAVIEEAAQVLESAAAYNRSEGRTVLQYTQQDRADRLRAILAAAPLYAAAQASAQADSLDAARYRWLRERMCFESSKGTEPEMSLARWIPAPLHDPHNDWMGERFDMSVDRTIDAAMSSTTGDTAIGEKGNG